MEQLEEMEGSKAQQKAAAEVKKNQSEAKLERLRKSLTRMEEAVAAKSKKEEVTVADDDVPLEDIETMDPDEENVHGDGEEIEEEEEEEAYEEEEGEEETEEERAKRVASQWIPGEKANADKDDDEDTYEAPYEAPPVESQTTTTTDTPPVEEEVKEEATTDADDRMDLISRVKMWVSQMIARATGKIDLEQDLVVMKAKVEAAQKQFDSANQDFFTKSSELSTLQNEKETLSTKLGTNYGTRNVFLQLSENCVEATIDKYVYSVCPFGDAHQSEGGRKTKLGAWKGFEGNTMVFTDGEGCWQGPSRSINITLKCGADDAFVSLAEPSRCTYTGVVKTPAHCTDELVENLQREVERKKALLQEYNVKDEL